MLVVFELCNKEERKCKTDDEIDAFLASDRYILSMHSEKRFMKH